MITELIPIILEVINKLFCKPLCEYLINPQIATESELLIKYTWTTKIKTTIKKIDLKNVAINGFTVCDKIAKNTTKARIEY